MRTTTIVAVFASACAGHKNVDPCIIDPGFTTEIVHNASLSRWQAVAKRAGLELLPFMSYDVQFGTVDGIVNDFRAQGGVTVIQLSSDHGAEVTGIAADDADNRVLLIMNAGPGIVSLDPENARSALSDRIVCPSSPVFRE